MSTGPVAPSAPKTDPALLTITDLHVAALKEIGIAAHLNAWDKGFLDAEQNFPRNIALMHSELSEALEADREGNGRSVKAPGFSQIEEELADVIIRIMQTSHTWGHDVAGAVKAKMAYNATRPKMHGGKAY